MNLKEKRKNKKFFYFLGIKNFSSGLDGFNHD